MKRKAEPDRIIESRPVTRLSEVVERRGKKNHARNRDHPDRATRTPPPSELEGNVQGELAKSQDAWESRNTVPPSLGDPKTSENKSKRSQRWTPMARAVAMLARREHSKVELVTKLMARGVEQEEAEQVVQKLEDLDLQSDQRFLESKVRQRVGGGYGPRRTQMELAGQGLDEADVEKALEEPGDGWIQGAYNLIERRYGESPLPFELRQKALGLLVRRGFSFEQAQQVIREPRPNPNED